MVAEKNFDGVVEACPLTTSYPKKYIITSVLTTAPPAPITAPMIERKNRII